MVRHEEYEQNIGPGRTLLLSRLELEGSAVTRTISLIEGPLADGLPTPEMRWSIVNLFGVHTLTGVRGTDSFGRNERCAQPKLPNCRSTPSLRSRNAPCRAPERERLHAALESDRLWPYFVVLGELGLRPQEADALPWADVDMDTGVVSILWAMKRGDGGVPLGIGTPKTLGSRRKLRLTSTAARAFATRSAQQAAERLAAGPVWSRDERWANPVFTSEIGTPVPPSNVRRTLSKAIRQANDDPELDSEASPRARHPG